MSLTIEANRSLKPFNTFAVDQRAQYFAEAHSDADVYEAIAVRASLGAASAARWRKQPTDSRCAGPGAAHGQSRQADHRRVGRSGDRRGGGREPWHPFVLWSLEQGLMGLENLSLIPGTVGASPIQNIGAYGVEIRMSSPVSRHWISKPGRFGTSRWPTAHSPIVTAFSSRCRGAI